MNEIHQTDSKYSAITALKNAIGQVIVGQEAVIEQTLTALLAAGHILIEGVPGLGKTLLARVMAKSIDADYSRIQFTPDLMPADVTGHMLYDNQNERFTVRRGPVFTHFLLADEINRAPAKTQAALLEVMQERQVTIEGESLPLKPPFMVMATQNPIEQEGTYPLPEAQLDRFMLKINIAYPNFAEEKLLVRNITEQQSHEQLDLAKHAAVISPTTIAELQQLVAANHVSDKVLEYAVNIVRATRSEPGIHMGAGPRASISLIRAAKAYSFLQERDFVTPDDIKAIAYPVLRHRISLSADLEIEGYSNDQVLDKILDTIAAPRD